MLCTYDFELKKGIISVIQTTNTRCFENPISINPQISKTGSEVSPN
jgi:hypothetical protein